MTSRQLRNYRHDRGLCYDCDIPPEQGRTRCRLHLNDSIQNAKNYRTRIGSLVNVRQRQARVKWRTEVFNHYGWVCICCNENQEEFLSIDHIANDGSKHRRSEPESRDLYQWLYKNNFPPGFQTLCRNCNWAKYKCGICPHQKGIYAI